MVRSPSCKVVVKDHQSSPDQGCRAVGEVECLQHRGLHPREEECWCIQCPDQRCASETDTRDGQALVGLVKGPRGVEAEGDDQAELRDTSVAPPRRATATPLTDALCRSDGSISDCWSSQHAVSDDGAMAPDTPDRSGRAAERAGSTVQLNAHNAAAREPVTLAALLAAAGGSGCFSLQQEDDIKRRCPWDGKPWGDKRFWKGVVLSRPRRVVKVRMSRASYMPIVSAYGSSAAVMSSSVAPEPETSLWRTSERARTTAADRAAVARISAPRLPASLVARRITFTRAKSMREAFASTERVPGEHGLIQLMVRICSFKHHELNEGSRGQISGGSETGNTARKDASGLSLSACRTVMSMLPPPAVQSVQRTSKGTRVGSVGARQSRKH
jgi:hypothetical protein